MSKPLNNDQIHRFIFDDADIRGEIVSLANSYQQASEHQSLPPTAKKLLGEFLAAASLLSEILKFNGTITVQARGDGPIPIVMADTSNTKNLRGIASVAEGIDESKLSGMNLSQLIGKGVLTLTMDPEQGQRYQGIVELSGDSLAKCLNNYFAQSEQLPTRLWLFADATHAGGIMLQSLPKQASITEVLDEFNTAEQLANTINPQELFELGHAEVLRRLFSESFTVRLFEGKSLQFLCQCSTERCANTLTTLGKEETLTILEEQGSIEINCEFCGNNYAFNREQLNAIFAKQEKERQSRLH